MRPRTTSTARFRGARACALGLGLAALTPGCFFDLDRLRGACFRGECPDAAPDVPQVEDVREEPPPFDEPSVDARETTPPSDASDAQPSDVPPDQPLDPCVTSGDAIDLASLPNTIRVGTPRPSVPESAVGRPLIINGTTFGRMSRLTPPNTCGRSMPGDSAPDILYRYVVERGPTLVASTEAPLCVTRFDTIVSIRRSCTDMSIDGMPAVISCNDDSYRLNSPACEAATAPVVDASSDARSDATSSDVPDEELPDSAQYTSSAVAQNLVPGQVVYIAVDGWDGAAGSFRLQLVENAAVLAPLPAGVDGERRCACQTGASTRLLTLPLNNASGMDRVEFIDTRQSMQLSFMLPDTRSVVGLSARLKLVSNSLATGCGGSAIFDLSIGGTILHSFEITAQTPAVTSEAGTVFTIPLQTFMERTMTGQVTFTVRLRAPLASACGAMAFDPRAPENEITLMVR